MSVKVPSILIIDDEPLMRLSMVDALKELGYQVASAANGAEGRDCLTRGTFDIMITDLRLPGGDGLALLQACKQRSPKTEVIVITAHGSAETAIEAMKLGAYDYITKPFSMEELLLIVERVTKVLALRAEPSERREPIDESFSFHGVVSANPAMKKVIDTVRAVASSDVPVLLVGEAGTGKELLAHAIHRSSPRRDQALIKVSCALLPGAEIEAEIFGREREPDEHRTGSRQRRSRIELAHKGTLFLDEVMRVPLQVQARLLRTLSGGKGGRKGQSESLKADVRLICSTEHDPALAVQEGVLLSELHEWLAIRAIALPPLRERKEDILPIAGRLLQEKADRARKLFKRFSSSAESLLARYSFPGNVRELESVIDRAVLLGRPHDEVQPWDLCGFQPCPYLGGSPQAECAFCREGVGPSDSSQGRKDPLALARDEFERQYILSVLEQVGGGRQEAAKILGISRKALWEKCKKYGIAKGKDDDERDAE